MRNFLERLLLNLSVFFQDIGKKFGEWADKFAPTEFETETEDALAKEDLSEVDFALRNLPTSFAEGLSSPSYAIRHTAAAKLVSWYVDQQGQPMLDDLIKAARVMLEDYAASDGDISYLVGAWKDQASATNPDQRDLADAREDKIFQILAQNLQSKN